MVRLFVNEMWYLYDMICRYFHVKITELKFNQFVDYKEMVSMFRNLIDFVCVCLCMSHKSWTRITFWGKSKANTNTTYDYLHVHAKSTLQIPPGFKIVINFIELQFKCHMSLFFFKLVWIIFSSIKELFFRVQKA